MNTYKVSFEPNNIVIDVPCGSTVLFAAQKAGLNINALCSGNGTCGKCLVHIKNETNFGLQKACQTVVCDNLTIDYYSDFFNGSSEKDILKSGLSRNVDFVKNGYYKTAVDIGTTTVVLYLLDKDTGNQIACASNLNPQIRYSADVVGRAIFAVNESIDEINKCIIETVNGLLIKVCEAAKISVNDIDLLTVAGNTCMHHIFSKIVPSNLLTPPYSPNVLDSFEKTSGDLGLILKSNAKIVFLPCIAGFVGADTLAAIIATDLKNEKETSLILDIGTNGEMVLKHSGKYICCSTAAGPAFEGAKISCGMRASSGAVNKAFIENNDLRVEVIDNKKAEGVCGSGLLDIVACLLNLGVIKQNGAFEKPEKLDSKFRDRFIKKDGITQFLIKDDVYLSQKDIRELQLAKSAICVGIKMLCEHFSIQPKDINKVMLAGAFGTFMNPDSAVKIKLFPADLSGKILLVGNAAGEGAKICAKNNSELKTYEELKKQIDFLELASRPDFQDRFIENLSF